jgi:CO/xanthine dehydrogenase Mo-binding subunit
MSDEMKVAKEKAKAIVDAAKEKAKISVDAAKAKAAISIEKAKAKAAKVIDTAKEKSKKSRKQKGGDDDTTAEALRDSITYEMETLADGKLLSGTFLSHDQTQYLNIFIKTQIDNNSNNLSNYKSLLCKKYPFEGINASLFS